MSVGPPHARYANPIKRDGDFADPFVLRFNGRYYLYGTNPDIRCWSSSDLVEWTLEGPTIADDVFPGLVPFAPEVVHSNGSFFMYTSPHGRGHYVLRSDHPTGPFELVSGNVEHSIDGNVLIDDDGRWYFYWAGDEGIWGCEMPTPTTFGTPVFTGARMGGWTEGPFVTKHDDTYRMTLTGNHYLNDGYRINAAVSQHPLEGYVDDPLNPVLLSVRGAVTGVGHSSSVVGPDLLSTYLIYHNLNPDETRDLNLARQVANGESVQVLGPVASAPVPAMPDARVDWAAGAGTDDWDVAGVLTPQGDRAELTGERAAATWRVLTPDGAFVAEVTLGGSASGRYGIELGRSDSVVRIQVDPAENTVEVGQGSTASLPVEFVHDCLHSYRIVHDGHSVVLFVDGRKQIEWSSTVAAGSSIGVFSERGGILIGYCGLTSGSVDAEDRASHKPVPGRFWAALGRLPLTALERVAGPVAYDQVRLGRGSAVDYDLDVWAAGEYAVFLTGEFARGDVIDVAVDSGPDASIAVDEPTRVLSMTLPLDEGAGALRLTVADGSPMLALVTLVAAPTAAAPFRLTEPARIDGVGKMLLGGGEWHDFVLETDLTIEPDSIDAHGGVIFRASQLSDGGPTSDDPVLGVDFLLGYSVELRPGSLVLSRHAYDTRVLASAPVDRLSAHLTVRMSGGRIEIALNGVETIVHDDPLPHLVGGVGLRTWHGSVSAAALSVSPG